MIMEKGAIYRKREKGYIFEREREREIEKVHIKQRKSKIGKKK